MKQGEIYEEPSEKYQIEDYINSLLLQDIGRPTHKKVKEYEYYEGYNDALADVLKFINKM